MKSAQQDKYVWLPATMIAVVALLIAGCSPETFSFGRSLRGPASPAPTSVPRAQKSESQQTAVSSENTTGADESADAQTVPIHERIQQYVGRFPSDDLDRKTRTTTEKPAASSASTQRPAERSSILQDRREVRSPTLAPISPADTTAEPRPATTSNQPAQWRIPIVPPKTDKTTLEPSSHQNNTTPSGDMGTPPAPQAKPITPPATETPSARLSVEITDIKPAPMTPVAASLDNKPTAANQPAAASQAPIATLAAASSSTDPLQQAIDNMETLIQSRPPHLEDQFKLRLLYLAGGKDEKATGPIEGVDPVQAEVLSAVFRAVTTVRNATREPTGSDAASAGSAALSAIDELRRVIGQQSGVVIPRIALVTRVNSFGDFDEISPLRFAAGQAVHAYVYTEVANFRTEPADDGKLRTALSQKVEVFNAAGESIWERTEPKIEDRTRSPRRDFFIPFPIHLPAATPPGNYILKVTIEDTIGATADQQRLAFTITKKN